MRKKARFFAAPLRLCRCCKIFAVLPRGLEARLAQAEVGDQLLHELFHIIVKESSFYIYAETSVHNNSIRLDKIF